MAARASNNEEDFFAYLARLDSVGRDYKPSPEISFDTTTETGHSGTEQFIEALKYQKKELKSEVDDEKKQHLNQFKAEICQCYELNADINPNAPDIKADSVDNNVEHCQLNGITQDFDGFVDFIREFVKKLNTIEGRKSDVHSSASTWKPEHLVPYISTLKIKYVPQYTPLKQPRQITSNIRFISNHQTLRNIMDKYMELAWVYLGVTTFHDLTWDDKEICFLHQLVTSEYREATSRVFVDALITPILGENNLQVRLEEKLYPKDLPNCIADYVIYNDQGEALGVIETKTGGRVRSESVIQCMLQLLALRTKAPHTLFGIVTDAVRYVFIVLTEDGTFEFEWKQCYHDVVTWRDLCIITGIVNTMLLKKGSSSALPN